MYGFAGVGHEDVEIEQDGQSFERLTYRGGLNYAVTQDIQSNLLYQYDVLSGTIRFTEHYLYLGVTKRF
jgi:hypothetical protein